VESETSTTAAVPDEELPIQIDVDATSDVEDAVTGTLQAGPVEDDGEAVNPADPTDESLLDTPEADEEDLEP
jgi:hypothetical protein